MYYKHTNRYAGLTRRLLHVRLTNLALMYTRSAGTVSTKHTGNSIHVCKRIKNLQYTSKYKDRKREIGSAISGNDASNDSPADFDDCSCVTSLHSISGPKRGGHIYTYIHIYINVSPRVSASVYIWIDRDCANVIEKLAMTYKKRRMLSSVPRCNWSTYQ